MSCYFPDQGEPPFVIPSSLIEPGDYSLITSVLVTDDKKLVMADYFQKEIKVWLSGSLLKVSIGHIPWSLALLSDGLVAVTTRDSGKMIDLVNVSGSDPVVVSTIPLDIEYMGVCQGDGDTLIASSEEGGARVDVISRDGEVVRTLVDGSGSSLLREPYFLTRWGDHVYVSDWGSNKVFRVELETGRVDSVFEGFNLFDLDLEQPNTVAFDDNGNMYVATGRAHTENQWRVLIVQRNGTSGVFLDSNVLGDKIPYGMIVDSGSVIVSLCYWEDGYWKSEIRAYAQAA
ncbi:hypothetical protein BaRGS_00021258 [Batillaria attramentaria]|uniref:SMP-30/Gluconolactonase/LRE-like region domain-containing protein n=1 Tax=Batillaria attramentaria TaxID=370345 RepID=A0ABD0KK11_9CAEN